MRRLFIGFTAAALAAGAGLGGVAGPGAVVGTGRPAGHTPIFRGVPALADDDPAIGGTRIGRMTRPAAVQYPCAQWLHSAQAAYDASVQAAARGDAAGRDAAYDQYLHWRSLYNAHCVS